MKLNLLNLYVLVVTSINCDTVLRLVKLNLLNLYVLVVTSINCNTVLMIENVLDTELNSSALVKVLLLNNLMVVIDL